MISLQDCIEYLRLTEEELDSIAAHEHVPAMIAAELAAYLTEAEDGERMIRKMILEDIAHAQSNGDRVQADKLTLTLKHFIATHPGLG